MSDRVVIKIGGSLLAEPGAMRRVADWLAMTAKPGQSRVLIAGGGKAVDAIREIDAANPLSDEAAHWAAIAVMSANAVLLGDWLPGLRFRIVSDLPQAPGDWILLTSGLLRKVEPAAAGEKLRIGWQTTSDAIAARIATLYEAQLVLLKHSLPATYDTLDAAAAAGVVDSEAPRIAASLASVRLLGVIQPGLDAAPW